MCKFCEISIYTTSDWIAIYKNGKLINGAHSFSFEEGIKFALKNKKYVYSFYTQIDDDEDFDFPDDESKINKLNWN